MIALLPIFILALGVVGFIIWAEREQQRHETTVQQILDAADGSVESYSSKL